MLGPLSVSAQWLVTVSDCIGVLDKQVTDSTGNARRLARAPGLRRAQVSSIREYRGISGSRIVPPVGIDTPVLLRSLPYPTYLGEGTQRLGTD